VSRLNRAMPAAIDSPVAVTCPFGESSKVLDEVYPATWPVVPHRSSRA
jgi:hypothetical protein